VAEGRIPEYALKHYDSDAPNVYSVVVAVLEQNFRSDVVRGSYFGKVPLPIDL